MIVALLDALFPAVSPERVARAWSAYAHPIGDGDDVYMRRWLVVTPWGSLRLHQILRSDRDRDLHDHPWDFWSLLLTGSYAEVLPASWQADRWCPKMLEGYRRDATRGPWVVVERGWLSVVRHRAEDLHRLVLPRPVWTLVWAGPRRRDWGFQTAGGWVPWRTYTGEQSAVGRGRP